MLREFLCLSVHMSVGHNKLRAYMLVPTRVGVVRLMFHREDFPQLAARRDTDHLNRLESRTEDIGYNGANVDGEVHPLSTS